MCTAVASHGSKDACSACSDQLLSQGRQNEEEYGIAKTERREGVCAAVRGEEAHAAIVQSSSADSSSSYFLMNCKKINNDDG